MAHRAVGSVPNRAKLAEVSDSYVVEGDEVYVQSDKTWCYYSLTSEGVGAVKAAWIPGYWCSRNPSGGAFNTQLVWYVDYVNGSDDNDGLTSGTAIKTFAQLRERVGTPWYLPAAQVDVYVQSKPFPGDHLTLNMVRQDGSSVVVFHGKETVALSAAFTARTNMDRTTNTRPDITQAAAGAQFVGLLIKDTATSPAKYAWGTADLGGGKVRTSAWLQFTPTSTTLAPAAATVGATDAFSLVDTLLQIYYVSIKVETMERQATACVVFDNFHLYPDVELDAPGGVILLSNCKLGQTGTYGPGLTVLQNCYGGSGGAEVLGNVAVLGGLVSGIRLSGGQLMLDYDAMLESSTGVVFVDGFTSSLLVDSAAFFMSGTDGLIVGSGGLVRCTDFLSGVNTLWGQQVTASTFGMNVRSGGRVVYDAGFDFTKLKGGAGGGDFMVSGAITGFPFDVAVPGYHAPAHTYTWAHLAAAIAAAGFAGSVRDPRSGSCIVLAG
jgi:hypothetical protein